MQTTGTYLAILIDELFTSRGDIKDKYHEFRDNEDFVKIERKLVSLHASFHCDVVGIHNFKEAKKELFSSAQYPCSTAPYPQCNGANGCDTCEHQPEEE